MRRVGRRWGLETTRRNFKVEKIIQILREAQKELDEKNDAMLDARLGLQAAQKTYEKAYAERDLCVSKISILITQLAAEAK